MPSRILLFDDEEISRESGQQETPSAVPECSTPPTTDNGKTKVILLQQPSAFTESVTTRWTDEARIQYFARDIRASSRLPGYAFCAITCLVLLVSTIMLIKNKDSSAFLFKVMTDGYHYIIPWKETAAVVFGAVGLGLSCIILMCHFDTMILPRLWESLFVDGSIHEMILLRFLLVIWSAGLYFCTSSFAVGKNSMLQRGRLLVLLLFITIYSSCRNSPSSSLQGMFSLMSSLALGFPSFHCFTLTINGGSLQVIYPTGGILKNFHPTGTERNRTRAGRPSTW